MRRFVFVLTILAGTHAAAPSFQHMAQLFAPPPQRWGWQDRVPYEMPPYLGPYTDPDVYSEREMRDRQLRNWRNGERQRRNPWRPW